MGTRKSNYTELFVEKLEKIREQKGYTQEQMAKKLELSTSGYKKIISGETKKIDLNLAIKLSELSETYLFEILEMETTEVTLVKKIAELSVSQKRFINGIVEFERSYSPKFCKNAEEYITVMEPMGDCKDGMILDSVNLSKVNIGDYRQRLGVDIHCGLKMNNNHLHPVYLKNDILLICKEPPRDGDVGIFLNKENGRAYIRKYRQTSPCRLEPVNGYGEVFLVDSDDPKDVLKWVKFGRVVTKIRD